jgi:hypothetical protein
VRTKPHVERLVRLLHNRVVRRVQHADPGARSLLLVGDLVGGRVVLEPTAVWDGEGAVLHPRPRGQAIADRSWEHLLDDLRPELSLLAQVCPVELFAPYVLSLHQMDLRLEVDTPEDEPTR